MSGTRVAVAALLLAAALTGAAAASESPTRSDYVAQLEKICKPRSAAGDRAIRGIRGDMRHERLRLAARKVSAAKRIFAGTVRAIARVPRPSADRRTLRRWFAALNRETAALERTAAVLRADDVAGFQRIWADFIRTGNKANNIVVSFGFNHCAFKPAKFT